MSDTNSQATLDTNTPELRLNRFEIAWRAGNAPPDWRQHLPDDEESCSPRLIFDLLQMDIEYRIKAGLPALLSERYFEHPRLQRQDARLDDVQQVELIQWEYLQRLNHGERPRRAEYEAAFPRHVEALREMKPPVRGTTPATELDQRGYQLIETLGKGGMGEVYRCCDPALGRDLAIKVMKAALCGHDEVERRFLREARITGSLQHPNIVPVHNLGRLADSRLHYTMRLVRGQTFAAILKEEAGRSERLPYLLTIFEKICQAVAYAHSKRVIHRDLKPHNVMVGRFGEVQVMDWGLAKVLTPSDPNSESEEMTDAAGTRIPTEADTPVDLTRPGSGFGTPAYMPPEQALGEWDAVDERADVFALGSILCEMLTGEPPYSGTDGNEVYRRAKRGDVAEALQRLQQCGADAALTALCRECLNPNREARPRDASAVAKRVAEHQAEVQERLRRAEIERAEAQLKAREARKQRLMLIALVLALLVGGTLSTWQAVRATAERDDKEIALGKAEAATEAERLAKEAEATQRKLAGESEEDAKAVLKFFQDKVLSAGRPEGKEGGLGNKVTLRQAVDAAEPKIAKSFADRPLVEASIRNTLGVTYNYLGEYPQAIQQHERALALHETKLGPDHPDTLLSRNNLAAAYNSAGRSTDAIRLHEQTLKQREAKLGPDHPDTLLSRNNLAVAYWSAGRTAEAIRLHEQTLKQSEAKLGPDHPQTLLSRNNLATTYSSAGRTTEAIRLHEQTLKQREAKLGPDHPDTLTSRNNLAEAYWSAGHTTDAIRLHEQTLKQREAKLGPDHPDTLTSRNNLATTYWSAGRITDAIRLHEQNLKQMEAKLGPDHPDTLLSRNNLAAAYNSAGRSTDAIRLHEQTLKQREAKLGPDHPDTLLSRNNLAATYWSAGRTAEAIRLHEQTLKQREAKLGPDHPDTLTSRNNLATTYSSAGRTTEAIRLHEQTLKQREAKLGPDHPDTLVSRNGLAVSYWTAGRTAEAIRLHEQNLKQSEAKLGPDHPNTLHFRNNLAFTYDQDGQCCKAEPLYRVALEQTRKRFGAEHPQTAAQMALLALNLLNQHKYADAEPLLRDCLKFRQTKQPDEWTTFNAQSLLGEALLGQKKYADAESLLLSGYQGMKQRDKKIPAPSKVRLTNALERLVQLYEATGKKDEAAKYRKQLEETKAAQKKTKP